MRPRAFLSGRSGRLAYAALGTVLLMLTAGTAAALPRPSDTTTVLAITQTDYITEQGTFTVSMQVTNTADIQFVYFTFCQLTSPVCYSPVAMNLQNSNWYVGTTQPMSSYYGMKEGALAGYNITIMFNDNTTMALPSIPNQFTNLSVVQSVTNEYMFGMTVKPQVYGLSGVVHDSITGTGVAGATVSLTPGTNSTTTSSTGAYSFSNLLNGSYTLSVSRSGYTTTNATVSISGADTVKDLQLVNASTPSGGGGGGGNSGLLFGLTPLELAIPAVVVVLALAIVLVLWRRKPSPGATPAAPVDVGESPSKESP